MEYQTQGVGSAQAGSCWEWTWGCLQWVWGTLLPTASLLCQHLHSLVTGMT